MVNWSEVDTVLLDMDGTLLDLHFDNFFWLQHLPKRYAEIHQIPHEDAQDSLLDQFQAERGSLQWYCTDYWSSQLNVDITALKREVSHLVASRPFMEEFLLALRQSQRHTLLVTNAHRDSVSLKMERLDLRPLLDGIISSHDYQLPKEDAGFWIQLQRDHPFDPSRSLLIDDNEAVLITAQQFGIQHLLTLRQPDSQQAPREGLRFPVIHHFDEILPLEEHRNG